MRLPATTTTDGSGDAESAGDGDGSGDAESAGDGDGSGDAESAGDGGDGDRRLSEAERAGGAAHATRRRGPDPCGGDGGRTTHVG